jgi:hypothetical protein
MDLEARRRFVDFSRAKDEMFVHTDTDTAPWYVVEADVKRNARLNCIAHLLHAVPYKPVEPTALKLPRRQSDEGYVRPDPSIYRYVEDHAAALLHDRPR